MVQYLRVCFNIREGNNMKKKIAIFIILMMTLSLATPFVGFGKSSKEISIMFTGDMHSHLEKINGRGGSAKIKTASDQIRAEYPQSFLLDGGDFSMGTPMQSVYKTDALELKMMARLGFDATTLGNHEFDYSSKGLAEMLNTAKSKENADEPMPEVVLSNIDWEGTLKNKDLAKNGKKLKKAFENYGVDDYTIVEKEGVKIAVFGVLGAEAISQAPNAGVQFTDYIERTKAIVSEIERNDEADLIVGLSHSGINEDNHSESEDVKLAQAVPEIDLILSAHSHTELAKPIQEGNTLIVASGEYSNNLGHIVIEKSGDENKIKSHRLIKLNSSVDDDPGIAQQVSYAKQTVNSKFFSQYGFSYDEVIARSSFSFKKIEDVGQEQGEEPLANLISDSFIKAGNSADGDKTKFDVAVVPAGTIRASINKGDITAAEAFNTSALGMGADGKAGYPLVGVYLTGKELKNIAEIDASISPKMEAARLYASGMSYSINKHRLILNRAFDIKLMNSKGDKTKIDNGKLYRVVCGLYSGQMLSAVTDLSHGLVSIVPKDKNGKEITNFNKAILKKDGRELKEWQAVANYIDDFSKDKVPAKYKTTEGRKVVDNTFNPFKIFSYPNNIAFMVIALLMIPVVIIVAIIIFLIKRKHSRRGYSRSMFGGSSRGRRRPVTRPSSKFGKRSNNKRPNVRNRGFSMKKKKRF